jgi:threonine/homoserine/homoserine lactone efflux protein
LIVLGLRTLSKPEPEAGVLAVPRATLRRIFLQGVIVNLLNPHTALFFFAFLPQFVNPSRGAVPLQIVTLGLLFILMSATTDAVWAVGAGTAGNWIRGNRRFARAQRYVTGWALIGLGAAAAVSGRRSK